MKNTTPQTTISEMELITFLSDKNSPTMFSMKSISPTEMNQYLDYRTRGREVPNPYFEEIKTYMERYKLNTGFDYETSLDGRLKKENKTLGREYKTPWFDMVSKSLVVDKKTHSKYYIRYQYTETSITTFKYIHRGNEIDKVLFEQFLKDKTDYSLYQGNLNNPLRFQVMNVQHILEVNILGNRFVVRH